MRFSIRITVSLFTFVIINNSITLLMCCSIALKHLFIQVNFELFTFDYAYHLLFAFKNTFFAITFKA
jgi:hypothetical protein